MPPKLYCKLSTSKEDNKLSHDDDKQITLRKESVKAKELETALTGVVKRETEVRKQGVQLREKIAEELRSINEGEFPALNRAMKANIQKFLNTTRVPKKRNSSPGDWAIVENHDLIDSDGEASLQQNAMKPVDIVKRNAELASKMNPIFALTEAEEDRLAALLESSDEEDLKTPEPSLNSACQSGGGDRSIVSANTQLTTLSHFSTEDELTMLADIERQLECVRSLDQSLEHVMQKALEPPPIMPVEGSETQDSCLSAPATVGNARSTRHLLPPIVSDNG